MSLITGVNMIMIDNGRWTQNIFLIIITIISLSLQREKDYGSNQNKPYYFPGIVTCKALFTGHQSTHTYTLQRDYLWETMALCRN